MWHDCPVPFQPYHRAGQAKRWKAVLEVVLAIVFAFVLMAIVIRTELRVAGVKKLKDLPPALQEMLAPMSRSRPRASSLVVCL